MSEELAQQVKFTPSTYREIVNFDDALALAVTNRGTDISDTLGDGFSLLENKDKLVDNRFIILDWSISESDKFADENGEVTHFATMRIVTVNSEKYIVNDGSTGIFAQLQELDAMGEHHPLNVSHGLRKSEYVYVDEKGKSSKAVTYYLSTHK